MVSLRVVESPGELPPQAFTDVRVSSIDSYHPPLVGGLPNLMALSIRCLPYHSATALISLEKGSHYYSYHRQ